MRREIGLLLGLVGALCGCGGSEDDTAKSGATVACEDFQDGYCDYAVECELLDRATCDDVYRGIQCRSDEAAEACSNALDDAECGAAPPEACSTRAVADPAPAMANCARYVDVTCERVVGCGQIDTLDQCRREAMERMGSAGYLNCDVAFSTSPRFEACIDELKDAACGAPLPPACRSVIHMASEPTDL
jgi:hypothetical protein